MHFSATALQESIGHGDVHGLRRNDAQGCTVEQVEINDQKFFRTLESEVKAVNKCVSNADATASADIAPPSTKPSARRAHLI